jgi:hypothetical protein
MRIAFASLLALAGVATTAVAQTPPTDTAAAPAAAPAPAPAAVAPAAPAPEAPAAAPAEPEPTLPTDGDGAIITNVLTKVCMPLVKGGDFVQLATAAGMKKGKKDGNQIFTLPLTGGSKDYSITLENPGSNKQVCSLSLKYVLDGEKPIIRSLNIWSYLHDPYMAAQRNDYVPATDVKRITNSWEYFTDHVSDGLVFVQLKKPDGSPLNAKYDQATLLYSERTF